MKKIKDILYDTNDILVALVILGLAGLLIYTRVDAILSYPERAFADNERTGGYIRVSEPEHPTPAPAPNPGPAGENGGSPAEDDEPELYSLYIAPDQPMSQIAQGLIGLGFFETEEAFFAALEQYDADTRIQIGNFILPANATTEELIDILTKPGL